MKSMCYVSYICILSVFTFGCNHSVSKKTNDIPVVTVDNSISVEKDPFHCNIDSLTLEILSKLTYSRAKQTCKTTIRDDEFILNQVVPHGSSIGLKNVFTEEELQQPIPMKQAKWEGKNGDYIEIWYQKINEKWIPVDSYQYSKGMKF